MFCCRGTDQQFCLANNFGDEIISCTASGATICSFPAAIWFECCKLYSIAIRASPKAHFTSFRKLLQLFPLTFPFEPSISRAFPVGNLRYIHLVTFRRQIFCGCLLFLSNSPAVLSQYPIRNEITHCQNRHMKINGEDISNAALLFSGRFLVDDHIEYDANVLSGAGHRSQVV